MHQIAQVSTSLFASKSQMIDKIYNNKIKLNKIVRLLLKQTRVVLIKKHLILYNIAEDYYLMNPNPVSIHPINTELQKNTKQSSVWDFLLK